MPSSLLLLPPHAPKEFADRETLWNAVEKIEQHPKAQLAYSFGIALQNEFSPEENIDLARQFLLDEFASQGMTVDFAVHSPDKEDGGIANPTSIFSVRSDRLKVKLRKPDKKREKAPSVEKLTVKDLFEKFEQAPSQDMKPCLLLFQLFKDLFLTKSPQDGLIDLFNLSIAGDGVEQHFGGRKNKTLYYGNHSTRSVF